MLRRTAIASVSVSALALAGCATIEKITGTTTAAAAGEAILLDCQYLLPLVDALALGISVAVPGSAVAMGAVSAAINAAGPIFQQLSSTMPVAQAQPLVQQIETYANTAVMAISNLVNTTPALSAYAPKVAQAQQVVGLLTTFVNGVTTAPTAAMIHAGPPPLLHR